MSYIAHLKKVTLFSGLNDRLLNIIQANVRKVCYPEGSIIIRHNDESLDLHIILSGTVDVTLINRDGRELLLSVMNEGDFFGELSLLDGKSRSATVTAAGDVEVLLLRRNLFLKMLKGNADLAVNLITALAGRLRKTDEELEDLRFLDVSGRLAKILIDVAKDVGQELPNGSLKIKCPIHRELANIIGCSREAVTRAFRILAAKGHIKGTAKEIEIDPSRLHFVCKHIVL